MITYHDVAGWRHSAKEAGVDVDHEATLAHFTGTGLLVVRDRHGASWETFAFQQPDGGSYPLRYIWRLLREVERSHGDAFLAFDPATCSASVSTRNRPELRLTLRGSACAPRMLVPELAGKRGVKGNYMAKVGP